MLLHNHPLGQVGAPEVLCGGDRMIRKDQKSECHNSGARRWGGQREGQGQPPLIPLGSVLFLLTFPKLLVWTRPHAGALHLRQIWSLLSNSTVYWGKKTHLSQTDSISQTDLTPTHPKPAPFRDPLAGSVALASIQTPWHCPQLLPLPISISNPSPTPAHDSF